MSREILFRGKRINNGEWVYGYLARFRNFANEVYTSIIQINDYETQECSIQDNTCVIPETVEQFTGLVDKNGKKIFENGYIIIDNKTYKVTFNNAEYILTNIFNCDTITLKNNSSRGVFVDEI